MVWPFICAPGAVFDVYRCPSHTGNMYKAWEPVENRYLGNYVTVSVTKSRIGTANPKEIKRPNP